jgi:ABC-type transport system involved in cytochrome c biogenesis permease subunit
MDGRSSGRLFFPLITCIRKFYCLILDDYLICLCPKLKKIMDKMLGAVHTLNIILPILYTITFLAYLWDFTHEKSHLNDSKRVFLFITLLLHTFYLIGRTVEFNHTPITNKNEIFTLLAFAIAFSYFILELISDVRGTGVFILVFSLFFQIISSHSWVFRIYCFRCLRSFIYFII